MKCKIVGTVALAGAMAVASAESVAATVDLSVKTVEELTNALATATADAANAYRITLAAHVYDLSSVTPMGTKAILDVSSVDSLALTLRGDPDADREDVVLDAKGAGRIIRIARGGKSTFQHLTFRNANTTGGGAAVYIDKYASYYFRDCVFRRNSGYGEGALTSAQQSQSTSFYDCLFEQNYIAGSSGGSLFVHPTLLTGCTFRANTNACDCAKALVSLASSATVTNCVFIGNATPGRYSAGGTLLMHGGTVVDCAFTNNSVARSGYATHGGALCLAEGKTPRKTDVRKCTFHGNQTFAQGCGGAIYNAATGSESAEISGCTFTGNYTAGSGLGGAIACFPGLITNCTFTTNRAYFGGGVYACSNVVDCVFEGNVSTGETGYNGGGAAYLSVISDSVLTNNIAYYQCGGVYACRVFRSVLGRNGTRSEDRAKTLVQEAMETYFEDCEFTGGSPYGYGFNNCAFNRCHLHDYDCADGTGYFIQGTVAITNCLFRNIVAKRFIVKYPVNFDNAMLNTTLADCTYNILSTEASSTSSDSISMVFANNLFTGIKTKSYSVDDDVGERYEHMFFTNNFIATRLGIVGAGNLDVYNDPSLKSRLHLAWQRDPAHPYAPRRLSILNGAGLVQGWMTNAVDSAGQPRLTNGKVAIGAYEPTLPLAGAAIVVR